MRLLRRRKSEWRECIGRGLAVGQTPEVAGPSKKMARRLYAIFYWMLDGAPVGLRLVIIVDAEVIVAVPVPTGALVVLRRLFELVLGKVGPISAEFCIVLQERPRRGVVIFAHSEEAAEAENGMCPQSLPKWAVLRMSRCANNRH